MILGGTTSTQGGGLDPGNDSLLARNVESINFGRQRILSRVGAIGSLDANDAAALRGAMSEGLLDAWLVHLAEGVRDGDRRAGDTNSSRAEFAELKARNLLTDATVLVHGVGLEPEDFYEMAHAPAARANGVGDGKGAKLVWSPLSNLLLYGKTAAVYDALAAGVLDIARHRLDPERLAQPVDRAEGCRSHVARHAAAWRTSFNRVGSHGGTWEQTRCGRACAQSTARRDGDD